MSDTIERLFIITGDNHSWPATAAEAQTITDNPAIYSPRFKVSSVVGSTPEGQKDA